MLREEIPSVDRPPERGVQVVRAHVSKALLDQTRQSVTFTNGPLAYTVYYVEVLVTEDLQHIVRLRPSCVLSMEWLRPRRPHSSTYILRNKQH